MGASLTRSTVEEQGMDYVMHIPLACEVPVEAVIAATEAAGKAILEIYNSEASASLDRVWIAGLRLRQHVLCLRAAAATQRTPPCAHAGPAMCA